MRATTRKSKPHHRPVEDALAEMSGVRMCEGPGCFRQLRGSQGKKTQAGDREIVTCFGVSCVDWAQRQADVHNMVAS